MKIFKVIPYSLTLGYLIRFLSQLLFQLLFLAFVVTSEGDDNDHHQDKECGGPSPHIDHLLVVKDSILWRLWNRTEVRLDEYWLVFDCHDECQCASVDSAAIYLPK